ncbi:MAG: hypothetical protein HOP33_11965 [Verrucomicrobia bacterium]|nr:hypothetical protein [Verrucomicrobiota bacterium]
MRTKTLFLAAAITAAGLASSMAQSNVYSLNVVGYVNTVLTGGGSYNLIANPLNVTAAGGNCVTNLFKIGSQTDGSTILRWNVGTQDIDGAIVTYSSVGAGSWDANPILNPGEGFFYVNNGTTITNTFVGEVIQGAYTNPVTGGGSFNCIGSSAPLGGSFTNSLGGLVLTDGDNALFWNVGTSDIDGAFATYSTVGAGSWDTTAINNNVGSGFFYVRQGASANWVRNFTVPTP